MPDARTIYLSPLRYPGGKGRLARFVGDLIVAQRRRALRYVEPFAGGAGVDHAARLVVGRDVPEAGGQVHGTDRLLGRTGALANTSGTFSVSDPPVDPHPSTPLAVAAIRRA